MVWGRVAMGALGSALENGLPKAVNSIGAVSPAMRETARISPVSTPGAAARSDIEAAIRQAGMPRACPGLPQAVGDQVQHLLGGDHHHRAA